MKTWWVVMAMAASALGAAAAEPVRVALLDFDDQTGMKAEAGLGGEVNPAALAQKGIFVLGEKLVNQPGYTLIDRRDFIAQMDKVAARDNGRPVAAKPSFLRAAQALNADVVLRGSLQGFSVGKQTVRQGGYGADFSAVTLRVGLQALDTRDGSVIAMASGAAQQNFRQTASVQTTLGEEDATLLLEQAIAAALPALQKNLAKRTEAEKARPVVRLSIKTTADPALVEIDGLLVGTTPMDALEVYRGDHVLTIGKAGYRDMTKHIVFERDSRIEVPMLRTELSAEEIKDVLDKARTNLIIGEPGITILPLGQP